MDQIFHACAYDIDTKTCCVMDADKFHENCNSFCGTVKAKLTGDEIVFTPV